MEGIRGGKNAGIEIYPEIDIFSQNKVRESFRVEYVTAERPQDRKTKVELKISRKEHQPSHFSPRCLYSSEKNVVKESLNII